MPIIFSPNDHLDVATDSVDQPEQVQGTTATSGAMLRCTNLQVDRKGLASTRKGTRALNTSAVEAMSRLIEQGGVRYGFAESAIYRNESSLESLTGGIWSAILYNPYNVTTQAVYALDGTNRKKIEGSTVYEWGIEAPATAPTVTSANLYAYATSGDKEHMDAAGLYGWQFTQDAGQDYQVGFQHEADLIAGNEYVFPETSTYVTTYHFEMADDYNLVGKWEVVHTYARYDGDTLICESNPSDAAEVIIESAIKVAWATPSDTQVTHVRIYRSLMDTAGQWFYAGVFAVADGSGVISAYDDELGAEALSIHERPPLGSQVIGPSFGGQLFILKDNLLYFSLPLQPEYWPTNYYIEVTPPQFPLMAGTFFGGNLILASEHEIFLVSGTSQASYFAQPMSAVTGTKSRNCFEAVKGVGVFHLGSDGIYLYTAGKDTCISDSRFKPLFEGVTVGSLPGWNKEQIANCMMKVFNNRLWFGYPAIGETYCKDFLVMDLETGKTVHYQYPLDLTCLAVDYENNRLLACTSTGYVWELDCALMTTDAGTAISWDLQSKEFVQFPKYFPRYARWDVDLGWQGTAIGQVLLEGTAKQIHTITADRQTRKRHVATCTGKRLSVRVYGTGPADIYGVEVE